MIKMDYVADKIHFHCTKCGESPSLAFSSGGAVIGFTCKCGTTEASVSNEITRSTS